MNYLGSKNLLGVRVVCVCVLAYVSFFPYVSSFYVFIVMRFWSLNVKKRNINLKIIIIMSPKTVCCRSPQDVEVQGGF